MGPRAPTAPGTAHCLSQPQNDRWLPLTRASLARGSEGAETPVRASEGGGTLLGAHPRPTPPLHPPCLHEPKFLGQPQGALGHTQHPCPLRRQRPKLPVDRPERQDH